MTTMILGMLAETFIHPGSGATTGAVDLPVAREAATDYPYMAGSSLKGALRDACEKLKNAQVDDWFGQVDRAGGLLISDARLLLLPVRSLSGAYRWVTCPHLLERWERDCRRAGVPVSFPLPRVERGQALAYEKSGALFLEELDFKVTGQPDAAIGTELATLIKPASTQGRLARSLVILSDDDFTWFARYGLAVQARNVLSENKCSENLWYEETLPPDTLMYSLIAARTPNAVTSFRTTVFSQLSYLQAGGNETVGQGWFILNERRNGGGHD